MVKKRVHFIFMSALALALVLAGCAQPSATPTQTGATTTPPTQKPTTTTTPPTAVVSVPSGELRIAMSTFSEEKFDPVKGGISNAVGILSPFLDWMFRLDGINLAPGIVEKWEMAPDGLSWFYYIRKGIKFHNGEDLKADDVKFSMERYASAEAFYRDLGRAISKVDIVDDYKLQVFTQGKQPYAPWLSTYISPGQGAVMPKDYMQSNSPEYFERYPVGTGPFKYVRHVPGDTVECEAVPNHWRQTPEFKKLIIILVPEDSTREAMLRTNSIDMSQVGVEDVPTLEASGFKTYAMATGQAMINLYGTHNPRGASFPTADLRVRKALSLAIDRNEIRESFFFNKANTPLPPFVTEHSQDIDTQYWRDYAAQVFRYDPVESKKLLQEAGYANGFSIKLYAGAQAGAPYLPKMAEVVQGYWQKVGVRAEIVPLDWGVLKKMTQTAEPAQEVIGQSGTGEHGGSPVTPKNLTTGFHSAGSNVLIAKTNPEVDRLIDAAMSEMDTAKRKELLSQIIKLTAETYTSLPIAYAPMMAAVGPRVDIQLPFPAPALANYADIAKHRK